MKNAPEPQHGCCFSDSFVPLQVGSRQALGTREGSNSAVGTSSYTRLGGCSAATPKPNAKQAFREPSPRVLKEIDDIFKAVRSDCSSQQPGRTLTMQYESPRMEQHAAQSARWNHPVQLLLPTAIFRTRFNQHITLITHN